MSDNVLPVVTEETVKHLYESLFGESDLYDPSEFISLVKIENPVVYDRINGLLEGFPEGEVRAHAECSLFLIYMLLRAQAVSDSTRI